MSQQEGSLLPESDNESEQENENEATIKAIENILAEFDAEEYEQPGDEEELNLEDGESHETLPLVKTYPENPDEDIEQIDAPQLQEILPPLKRYRSRSSSSSDKSPRRISVKEQELDEEWAVVEDYDYESDEYEYVEAEANEEIQDIATDLTNLLQEISNFEQRLDDTNEPQYYDYGDYGGGTYENAGFETDEDQIEEMDEEEEYPVAVCWQETNSSEQDFINTIMTIPEDEAEAELEKTALIEDVKDLLASFRMEADELGFSPGDEYVSKAFPIHNRCPSIESFFRQGTEVNVYIYLLPGRKMISKEVRLDTTIMELKASISRYCKINPELLDMRLRHNLLSNSKTLAELGAKPQQKMRFTVELNKRMVLGQPGDVALKIPDLDDIYEDERPDTVRQVNIMVNGNSSSRLESGNQIVVQRNVVIVHPKLKKPMIGGFKDKRSSLIFHDASTSTTPDLLEELEEGSKEEEDSCRSQGGQRRNKASWCGVDRAVQVFSDAETFTQTFLHVSTQVDRDGLYYSSEANDRFLIVKPYKDFDTLQKEQARAVTVIARYWRSLAAKRQRKQRFDTLIARVAHAEKIRKGRLEERKIMMDKELQRQQNPTRLLDLELLYREINIWRAEQEKYIMDNRWGPERKAALATLAEMEVDLLLELERTKRNIISKGRDKNMHEKFKQMGLPKRWFNQKYLRFLSFDTEGRGKCRKLHDIYKALLEPVEHTTDGQQNRLELIKGVHQLLIGQEDVKRGQIPMADMLNELFTREIKFMGMAGAQTMLSGIRRRVANTFFFLCMDPVFNEEARRVDKIPWDIVKLQKDMVQCSMCRRIKYRYDFTIEKGTTVTLKCRSCVGLYRTAILRIDLNIYRQMLDELRRDEFQAGILHSVSYLIDAFDIRLIVEQIWHSQSALSGTSNRYMLRLCRWHRYEPWTPWNCILLSEEEAVSHLHLDDMKTAYQPTLFHKVRVKHATAKIYFKGLAKLSLRLDDRIEESCQKIKDSEKRALAGIKKLKKKANILSML